MATPQPKNHAPFTIADALAATGGRLAHAARALDIQCVGVAIDSRAVEPGNVFVAIVGERFDGHDHARSAVTAGARMLIVSREVGEIGDAHVVVVSDTEKALGALARFHRRRWGYQGLERPRRNVVAITGSAGKTTTRRATASMLASLGRSVHSSLGNLNNAIGVPLTLLGLTAAHDVCVVEIGTNARGEIAHGASITEPDVAVLTLVAEAHTEGIGSIWDVAEEKGALFSALRRWGTAIANGDDLLARAQLPRSPARSHITYGAGSDVDVRLVDRATEGARGIRLRLEVSSQRIEALVPLLGKAGAYAALAAVSVAFALDPSVAVDAIARGLASLSGSEPGRLDPVELSDGTILIDDAYNANPASMIASIETASEIARALGKRLVLVIGEMFELGPESAALHAKTGEKARALGDAIIAVSGAARVFVDRETSERVFVPNVDGAREAIAKIVRPGDVVLVKASHSVGLEGISRELAGRAATLTRPTVSSLTSSSPAISGDGFRDALRGSNIVVVGLGKSGVAAALLTRRLGANVIATDSASEEKLSETAAKLRSEKIRVEVGGHANAGLDRADLVIVSPGVPSFAELEAASNRGVPVIGEIELATRLLAKTASIAITGSNGKSTTTLLVGELLRAAGKTPFVGGNLGDPPSEIVSVATPLETPFDVLVLEVSSYQAERMPTFHPKAAALLNLSPNHLDRYDDYEGYVRAKGNLFVNQTKGDVAVIPADDSLCAREALRGRARLIRFGSAADKAVDIAFTQSEIVDRIRGISFPRSSIRLSGDHNALNVCAALGLVSQFDIGRDVLMGVFSSFIGLPHRIAFVREVDNVRYYDDSKGTNVGATVAAMRGLSEAKVVLIAGGRDKLGSYDPLVHALKDRGRGAVLIGEAATRIADAIGNIVPIAHASSMQEAVVRARAFASSGDAVLLSPACSSFDMFRDYKHRGDAFVEAVVALSPS